MKGKIRNEMIERVRFFDSLSRYLQSWSGNAVSEMHAETTEMPSHEFFDKRFRASDIKEGAGQIAPIRLRQPCEQRVIASVLHACLRLRTIFAHRGAALLEPESGVESVFCNELVMTSLLDDPAMI
jgi:hypothetical protein